MAEKKKESSSARRARLSKERTARRQALKAKGAKNTKTFISGVADMLYGKKDKPKAKPKAKTQKALPPGKKGGAIVKSKGSAITKTDGKGGKLATRGGKIKKYGAITKSPGGALARRGGGGVGAGLAQTAGAYLAGKMAETIGKKGQSKMSRLGIKGGAAKSKPAATAKPKMKPSPGMSKGAVEAAKKGAAAANKSSATPKKKVSKVSAPKATKKAPVKASKSRTAAPKKSAIHTYKKHGSALHVGRYKTLKEHRAAVEAQKKKKQK